jgi:hypothetical protein
MNASTCGFSSGDRLIDVDIRAMPPTPFFAYGNAGRGGGAVRTGVLSTVLIIIVQY